MSHTDPLTAEPDAISRRDPDGPLRLGDVARAFVRYGSPKIIALALAATLLARVAIGGFGWRDLVLPGALIVLEPITEWVIHVYLLHARPIRLGSRSYDLLAAREHRAHHAAPTELAGVLVPTYALLVFVPAIAAYLYVLSLALHPLVAGDRLAWWLSGLSVGYAILLTYEWCHFLIHTPYRPRGRYYKIIWRNHRLHHYKNEHYWFGVTSNLGDSVLGTNPEQSAVAKSPTARSLGTSELDAAAGAGP
jgi:Fatty acid hydroxylase superfamily